MPARLQSRSRLQHPLLGDCDDTLEYRAKVETLERELAKVRGENLHLRGRVETLDRDLAEVRGRNDKLRAEVARLNARSVSAVEQKLRAKPGRKSDPDGRNPRLRIDDIYWVQLNNYRRATAEKPAQYFVFRDGFPGEAYKQPALPLETSNRDEALAKAAQMRDSGDLEQRLKARAAAAKQGAAA